MFHLSGLFGGTCANARACLNVIMSRFDIEDYMRLTEKYKVRNFQKEMNMSDATQ